VFAAGSTHQRCMPGNSECTPPEELIAAAHTISDGDSLLSPCVTRRVIDRMAQQPTHEFAGPANLDDIITREWEC
jgi:hypothetical protein